MPRYVGPVKSSFGFRHLTIVTGSPVHLYILLFVVVRNSTFFDFDVTRRPFIGGAKHRN